MPGYANDTCSNRMPSRSRDGHGAGRADATTRRRVVLEPREPPRAVHPDAAQEADLADRGADVRREARARGEHQQHVPRGRVQPGRDEHDRADVRARRRPPTPSACHAALVQPRGRRPARTSAPTPRGARAPAAAPMPCQAHLLRRRGRGGDQEQVPRQARVAARRAPRPRARRRAASVDVSTVGSANSTSSASAGWIDSQQRDGHAEPQDPAAGREQRHVHVVEHEHLVAQHGEPVEILGPLLVRDGRDPTPAAPRRATRARSSRGRGSGAARAR